MSEVGAIVVTHNSAEVIERCVRACSGLDVIVIDNCSHDDTASQIASAPGVRLIRNSNNRGFAAAVNQGAAAHRHEFLLLLNPDVELTSSIDPLIAACRQPGTAIASGKLLDKRGCPQAGFTIRRFPTGVSLVFEVLGINRVWPRNPVNRSYRYLAFDLDATGDVEQPAGAFLMFRRSVWSELGGFDEQFHPLWFEDVDFCKRARDLGWKTRYVPQVTARHLGGHSISKLDWANRERYWYASLLRYACKHFRPWAFRGVSAAVVLGSILRMPGGVVTRRSLKPVTVYASIIRVAFLSLIYGRMPGPLAGASSLAG